MFQQIPDQGFDTLLDLVTSVNLSTSAAFNKLNFMGQAYLEWCPNKSYHWDFNSDTLIGIDLPFDPDVIEAKSTINLAKHVELYNAHKAELVEKCNLMIGSMNRLLHYSYTTPGVAEHPSVKYATDGVHHIVSLKDIAMANMEAKMEAKRIAMMCADAKLIDSSPSNK